MSDPRLLARFVEVQGETRRPPADRLVEGVALLLAEAFGVSAEEALAECSRYRGCLLGLGSSGSGGRALARGFAEAILANVVMEEPGDRERIGPCVIESVLLVYDVFVGEEVEAAEASGPGDRVSGWLAR